MGSNIEKKYILENQRSLVEIENERILNNCGIISLFNELRVNVASKRDDQVISKIQPGVDLESLSLIYIRGDFSKFNEKPCESLVITASIKDKNTIHLMSREFEQNGEIKTESSNFDISNQDKKKEMLEKIKEKFSTSLVYSKKIQE